MTRFHGLARALDQIIPTTGVTPGPAVNGAYIGIACSVFNSGSLVLASIFADADGAAAKPNPFSINVDGAFAFFGPASSYDLRFAVKPASPQGVLSEVRIPSYTKAGLPAANPNLAGRIARVSDSTRELWMDTGSDWLPVSGAAVNVKALDEAVTPRHLETWWVVISETPLTLEQRVHYNGNTYAIHRVTDPGLSD